MILKDLLNKNSTIIYKDKQYRFRDILQTVDLQLLEDFCSTNCGIFIENSIEYIKSYFSIAYLKRVIVPIPIMAKKAEIISTIKYCELSLILVNTKSSQILNKYIRDTDVSFIAFNIDDNSIQNYGEAPIDNKKHKLLRSEKTEDTAIMLHTSGTTSNPKRVMLTHNNLFSNIKSNIKSLGFTKRERSLILLPIFFGYCNTAQLLTHIYLEATIVIMDVGFLPAKIYQYLQKYRITNFTAVPSMLLSLLHFKNKDRYDTSHLKTICFGGGAIQTDKLKEIFKLFPNVNVIQTYGQTEASPRVTALLPEDAIRKIGSVGKPIPDVNVMIVDENNDNVKTGVPGEIIVNGPNVMKGYYKQQDLTDQVIKNGWLHTGDIAYYDEEQYIYLVGRKKNIIISGGINIYPQEIEEILLKHPWVKEAIVYSVSHPIMAEIPIADIVPTEIANTNTLRKNLLNYCVANLAQYKVPAEINVVKHLLKTNTGKIKRIKENAADEKFGKKA